MLTDAADAAAARVAKLASEEVAETIATFGSETGAAEAGPMLAWTAPHVSTATIKADRAGFPLPARILPDITRTFPPAADACR
jgi:hypothetical protein